MNSWVVVTSRAGVHNKGLWKIAGHTLVEWVLRSTEAYAPWTIVTTDQPEVMHLAKSKGLVTVVRPEHLCAGEAHMQVDAVLHALEYVKADEDDIVHLVQPTSPFIDGWHIRETDSLLRKNADTNSAYTISSIPHNYHYLNHRCVNEGHVDFVFSRNGPLTKQQKSVNFKFGTVVSIKHSALKECGWFFTPPSRHVGVSRFVSLDVDTVTDLLLAEAIVKARLVFNPFKE